MRARTNQVCLAAGLFLGSPAGAEQWFTFASPDLNASGTRVEVDLDSVRARGAGGEGVIRVTQQELQLHNTGFRYQSFVANALFDCQRRSITLTSATYFSEGAGMGSLLGANSLATQGGMPPALLDSIPVPARRALLKATCATTHTSAG
jgi:hypothetical protein